MEYPIIEKGLCQCGCGRKTSIAKQNHGRSGYIKGQPMKYIYNHYARTRIGPSSANWKGGRKRDSNGYILIWKPDHSRSNSKGYVFEHILVTEKILGKLLPNEAVVHHVNEDRADNRKENLVICENNAYHTLLHCRIRAFKACGYASWRKCTYCKKWDNPKNLFISKRNNSYHKKCIKKYYKQWHIHKKDGKAITSEQSNVDPTSLLLHF